MTVHIKVISWNFEFKMQKIKIITGANEKKIIKKKNTLDTANRRKGHMKIWTPRGSSTCMREYFFTIVVSRSFRAKKKQTRSIQTKQTKKKQNKKKHRNKAEIKTSLPRHNYTFTSFRKARRSGCVVQH